MKKNVFYILITFIIALLILFIGIKIKFKSASVNEGKFRVNDAVLTSTALVENKTESNGVWSIDASQKNKLALQIVASENAEIDKVYIENIYVDKANVAIFEENSEKKLIVTEENNSLELDNYSFENNVMVITLEILNENILKNYTVPEGVNELVYDGRAFKKAGLILKDIRFNLSCDLVIAEKNGKINRAKINLVMPYEELLENGADVRKLSISNFAFKVS